MQLSNNQFNVYPSIKGKQSGVTITLDDLIKKIKTKNPVVELAREHGKGTVEYDELKVNNLECFYPNLWSLSNFKNPKYNYGTGFIYLDIDCNTKEQAIDYRFQLINQHPYIYACWLSLSEKGLGLLVKVENGGKFYFDQYWNKLYEVIEGVDPATKNYNRLNVISQDYSIYVNKDCKTLDSVFKFESNTIKYCTQLPSSEYHNINTPVIYADGKEVIEINLFKYKKRKIENGHRNKTIGRIGSMLIALNPDADYQQLLNALLSINKNYCSVPLTEKEVINSLKSNLKKYHKGKLDVSKYHTKKRIFWHPNCQLNRNERIAVGRRLLSESKFKQREDLILDTIRVLKNQSISVTVNNIIDFTSLKKSTLYNIITKSKKVQSVCTFSD